MRGTIIVDGRTTVSQTTKRHVRSDGRNPDALRPLTFTRDFAPAAAGSVLIRMGRTTVLCAASVQESVPRWMQAQKVAGGWITAEYSMLPYASEPRSTRESTSGRIGGRTQEIQRLIGRSLRAIVDLEALGARTIWVDCDVIQADGGTRTASITGAYVALQLAVDELIRKGLLEDDPVREAVAAVSVGMVGGTPLLDLCYEEDAAADVDMNVVMTASGRFVEVQGTAETDPFARKDLDRMLKLAGQGVRKLIAAQKKAIR